MKLYQLTMVVVLTIISLTIKAQSQTDLSSLTESELKTLQDSAVSQQDYLLADKIKNELQQRISIDDRIAQLEAKLKEAAANEDYKKASEYKDELSRLKANKAQQEKLKAAMKLAEQNEDYQEANRIKEELEKLTLMEVGVDSSGSSFLIFEPYEDCPRSLYLSVHVDDHYIGDVDDKTGLQATVKPGEHTIRIGLLAATSESHTITKKVYIKPGEYTVFSFSEFVKSHRKRFGTEVKVETKTSTSPIKSYEVDEVNAIVLKYKPWNNFEFPFTYAGFMTDVRHWATQLPEGADKKFKFNLGLQADISVSPNYGLYLGWRYSVSYLSYNANNHGYSYYALSIAPRLQYYFVNSKYVVPYAGFETPLTGVNDGEFRGVGTNVLMNCGVHFFLGKGTALNTEYKVGVDGSWTVHVGLSGRLVPKRRRTKMAGTYLYDLMN